MKNRNSYFISKEHISIYFIDVMGRERYLLDLYFPMRRKNKFRTALERLEKYGYADVVQIRIEWNNVWQGRKKGTKRMVINFKKQDHKNG